jgi:hypothetical protein
MCPVQVSRPCQRHQDRVSLSLTEKFNRITVMAALLTLASRMVRLSVSEDERQIGSIRAVWALKD